MGEMVQPEQIVKAWDGLRHAIIALPLATLLGAALALLPVDNRLAVRVEDGLDLALVTGFEVQALRQGGILATTKAA